MIAAISGRALAASARRAGLVPLVADFFADADTARLARACCQIGGSMRQGMRWRSLRPALEGLAAEAPSPPIGVVYGSGFEGRPELIGKMAERWRLIGNGPGVVARIKNPECFFSELDFLGIAHPRVLTSGVAPSSGIWLRKRMGGAGGSHIRRAPTRSGASPGIYLQEQAEGRPVSALFVGNGKSATVLGFSEQWTAPRRRARWRFGGALRPAALCDSTQTELTEWVKRLARSFGLQGLGSADFLVQDGERAPSALLLEVNPRPGATLDIFDTEAKPLLRMHLQAVLEHRLPAGALHLPGACAAAVLHAPEPIVVPNLAWPDWVMDQPKMGERIDKERPICTVSARAETVAEAKRLVEERSLIILNACLAERRGKL